MESPKGKHSQKLARIYSYFRKLQYYVIDREEPVSSRKEPTGSWSFYAYTSVERQYSQGLLSRLQLRLGADWARYVYSAKRAEKQEKRLLEMETILGEEYKSIDRYRRWTRYQRVEAGSSL